MASALVVVVVKCCEPTLLGPSDGVKLWIALWLHELKKLRATFSQLRESLPPKDKAQGLKG